MSAPLPRTLAIVDEAAFEAADRHIEQRIAEALMHERMSLGVTVATRERSACVECLSRAVIACQEVVQEKRSDGRFSESHGALACIDAVRALMPMEGV